MSDESFTIDIEGLEPVIEKFKNAPKTLSREMKTPMEDSMLVLREKTPGYPPQRSNQKTPYVRRGGTPGGLAYSLGMTEGGGLTGNKPSVYMIKGSGNQMSGAYGTNAPHAPYVIGKKQARIHQMWWWTMDFVRNRAKDKIQALWDRFIDKMMRL